MSIELYKGDCLEVMKDIKDKSIDCIITDPPYLIKYKTNHRKNKKHDFCSEIQNDKLSNIDLIENFIQRSFELLKDNSAFYCFCSWKTEDLFKQLLEQTGFKIKNQIIWVKNNWTAGDLKAQYGQQYEICFYCNKGRKEINGKRLTDVWFFNRVVGNQQLHQNQKPIELLEQIIIKSTNQNDIILDPFMGSGSTGVACANTNRNFIGIELDENYFNVAKKRIEDVENI